MSRTIASAEGRSRKAEFTTRFVGGVVIFREGEPGAEMYIIREGAVEIEQTGGRRLATLGPGDFFGEISLLDDRPRSATARAASDCDLVVVERSAFVEMLRENPEIAVRMLRKLSRRLRETDRLLRLADADTSPPALDAPAAERPPQPAVGPQALVHEASGRRFPLAGEVTSLGRHDPVTGVRPDVDLTKIDRERSSSRRHATLRRDGERLVLSEEIGVMNGTWVDGERLATGEPHPVEPGSTIRLGLVELVLDAGEAPGEGAEVGPGSAGGEPDGGRGG